MKNHNITKLFDSDLTYTLVIFITAATYKSVLFLLPTQNMTARTHVIEVHTSSKFWQRMAINAVKLGQFKLHKMNSFLTRD